MQGFFRHFWFSVGATSAVIIATLFYGGLAALLPLVVLIVIEVTFSFDNAVVNAKVLKRLSPLWRALFLSVGIIIAIFGMRLVFPIVMVMLTAHLPWGQVIDLAFNRPDAYAHALQRANPSIASFGGAFLLMLSLHFFMADNKHHWIEALERPLQAVSRWWTGALITAAAIVALSLLPSNQHAAATLDAGLAGIAVYLAIHGLTALIGKGESGSDAVVTGWAALATFIYLQILDASFSFDSVLGAFAITNKVLLIAAGLGAGAVWVRSFTVYMVERGMLEAYRFLEHGAHYAIAVLAVAMLLASAIYEIPSAVTGLVGISFIIGSIFDSIKARR